MTQEFDRESYQNLRNISKHDLSRRMNGHGSISNFYFENSEEISFLLTSDMKPLVSSEISTKFV